MLRRLAAGCALVASCARAPGPGAGEATALTFGGACRASLRIPPRAVKLAPFDVVLVDENCGVLSARLEVDMPAMAMHVAPVPLPARGPRTFAGRAALTMAGAWRAEVVIATPGGERRDGVSLHAD